jgi:membrane-associated phospholipid phosphatase
VVARDFRNGFLYEFREIAGESNSGLICHGAKRGPAGMIDVTNMFIQDRPSPVLREAMILTSALATITLIIAISTRLTFIALPNMLPLIAAVLVLDVLSQFAPETRTVRAVQVLLYGVLFLAVTCFCGVLAAYATQRLAFPLQDQLFESADRALGVNWLEIVQWVDHHAVIQAILNFAYSTMPAQIALPVVVLAFSDRVNEVRSYLLSFVIALTITTIVAAFLPAASQIAHVDKMTFDLLRFPGATPLDHLASLRSAGPIVIGGRLGGILAFPSFHATVAVLTPLALRRYRWLFVSLLILDAAMLCSTVTEGAHYASDTLGGCVVAIAAYFLAKRVVLRSPTFQKDFYASVRPDTADRLSSFS